MKWFYWTLIFLAFFTPIVFIGKGVDHLDIMKDRYKRALDAGASSAARAVAYDDRENIERAGMGFGTEEQDGNNIAIDKDNALKWFYRVFYRNLGIQNDPAAQAHINKYIPMKAIAGFDRLMIADVNDSWIAEKYYDISFKGNDYRFTLSDQVLQLNTGMWGRDTDFGINPRDREALVNEFIRSELNNFLYNRENQESGYTYLVNISPNDDTKTDNISGISFIVMAEGLPLPSLNPWRKEKYYAFTLGGTEMSRD